MTGTPAQRRARELNYYIMRLRGVEQFLDQLTRGYPVNFRRPPAFQSSAELALARVRELIGDIQNHRND